MMTPEQLAIVTQAMEEWTYGEWRQFADRIEEDYNARRNDVQLTRKGAADVRRLIAMENGWPCEAETPTQTRMGF